MEPENQSPELRSFKPLLGDLWYTLRRGVFPLYSIVLLFVVLSLIGITWGLPSRAIDRFLFPGGDAWSGEKIYSLAGGAEKFGADARSNLGADVDVNPLQGDETKATAITGTDADAARIYMRYRLYTYQPDEMISMMALAGMNPRRFQFDPRLYQYGGLFIYPIGALLALGNVLGVIDVRSDVSFYLDHPEQFAKFYIVARAYSAAWGALGVVIVYAIARRLAAALFHQRMAGGDQGGETCPRPGPFEYAHHAGLFAALLYTIIPVVVCMSHEGKPHLPGAVLMLLAVLFAMRAVAKPLCPEPEGKMAVGPPRSRRDFFIMCICCGAALGMVLSSLPIFILIPLVSFLRIDAGQGHRPLRMMVAGLVIAFGVYFITNPYVAWNAVFSRDVIRSNFGNSLGMYEVSRFDEGFIRVVRLTVEGARFPVVVLGTIGLILALLRRGSPRLEIVVLGVPATLFFVQFCLIGAGKPPEYGRFGIFTNASLAICAGCVMAVRWRRSRNILLKLIRILVLGRVAMFGGAYLYGFYIDAAGAGSRTQMAERLARLSDDPARPIKLLVEAEPAPYCCPPINFAGADIKLARTIGRQRAALSEPDRFLLRPLEIDPTAQANIVFTGLISSGRLQWLERPTPISWANKPLALERGDEPVLRPGEVSR